MNLDLHQQWFMCNHDIVFSYNLLLNTTYPTFWTSKEKS